MNLATKKRNLIKSMITRGTLKSSRVISAFKEIPRESFLLEGYKDYAYIDEPMSIGSGQTISQPTTVAIMTESLKVKPGHKVLEVGSGSGYQAAILSKIVGQNGKIITIERIPKLVELASKNLKNYDNVKIIQGDGSRGFSIEAPFDRIIVTAAASKIPSRLFDQLKDGGIMVAPIGGRPSQIESNPKYKIGRFNDWFRAHSGYQKMLVIKKSKGKKEIKDIGSFIFVPLVTKN